MSTGREHAGAALLAACLVTGAHAAEKANPVATKGAVQAETTYDDPLGRSTPQGTALGFLRAMQREDLERAVDYLDTRQTGKRAEQLARELNYTLNEGMSTITPALSVKPEGNLQDNLPDNRELVGTVKTKRGEYKILLERVQKENNPPVWLFSSETLKLVPKIYEEIDVPWLERHLPAAMTENYLLGHPLYRWIIPLVVLPLALLLGWLVIRVLFALVREPMRNRLGEAVMNKLRGVRNPLMLLFSAGAVYIISLGSASLLGRLFWTFLASKLAAFIIVPGDLADAGLPDEYARYAALAAPAAGWSGSARPPAISAGPSRSNRTTPPPPATWAIASTGPARSPRPRSFTGGRRPGCPPRGRRRGSERR